MRTFIKIINYQWRQFNFYRHISHRGVVSTFLSLISLINKLTALEVPPLQSCQSIEIKCLEQSELQVVL